MSNKVRRGRRSGNSEPVDQHVAGRVRELRLVKGMSQEELGKGLGLSFQQVQKYERGTNRISAGRLMQIARCLDVPVAIFYDGAPGTSTANMPLPLQLMGADANEHPREALELVRNYFAVPEGKARHALYQLVKHMGANHTA